MAPSDASILQAALSYAARGLAIFPATAAVKKSHKAAVHSNGARWGATRDPDEIRCDFTRWAGCRIGLPTGADNRIVVIEVDTVEGHGIDGAASLAQLEAKYGALPETLQAVSPSGSIHRYFRHPSGKIKSTASTIGEGIDVRGDGGMVIAPPSINPDGRRYRWLNPRCVMAAMPLWLIELTRERPPTISQRAVAAIRPPTSPTRATSSYGSAALEDEIEALTNTAPGGRNHALNRASFNLHQLVAGGELGAHEVRHRLLDAAVSNGLVADDGLPRVQATIESGARAGLAHPRSRPERV